MNPLDRVTGPSLPANRLRRVEERRREQGQREQRPGTTGPEPRPRKPDGEGPGHRIDELA